MKHVPNFITSLNLVSGFTAIVFAAHGNLVTASWFILAAMIFDFLDGFSARLLKAYSPVGKELDSLADVVSFGVAPGLIIYYLLIKSLSPGIADFNTHFLISLVIILVASVMPVCGAIRLAIFNIDTTQSTTFRGLPIPANALGVISIVIAGNYSHSVIFNNITASPVCIILIAFTLSLLMVSRIPLLSLKMSNLKLKGNEARFMLVGLVIAGFIIFGAISVPFIIPVYIICSLVSPLF